jgi:hypothetical protein
MRGEKHVIPKHASDVNVIPRGAVAPVNAQRRSRDDKEPGYDANALNSIAISPST